MNEERLAHLHRHAARAFPGVSVPVETFAAHLAHRLGAGLAGVDEVRAEDLYLACACSQGSAAAIELVQRRHARVLEQASSRAAAMGGSADDFKQVLSMKLFVREGDRSPFIASYAGRGPLGGWLRVVASRFALEWIDRHCAEDRVITAAPREDWWADAVDAGPGIDRSLTTAGIRRLIGEAARKAVAALTPEDRSLLRQYYAQQVGIDGLARLLGVHRSNASRHLARARGRLLDELRAALGDQLGERAGVDSLLGLVRTDLGAALASVLSLDRSTA